MTVEKTRYPKMNRPDKDDRDRGEGVISAAIAASPNTWLHCLT